MGFKKSPPRAFAALFKLSGVHWIYLEDITDVTGWMIPKYDNYDNS